MKRQIAILAVVLCAVGGAARAADSDKPNQESKPQPVALGRIITSVPDGTAWATFLRKGKGLLGVECWPLPNRIDKLIWHAGDVNIDRRKYLAVFASELKNAGFAPA